MTTEASAKKPIPWASTVSPEFRAAMSVIAQAFQDHPLPPTPGAHDLPAWRNTRAHFDALLAPAAEMAIRSHPDIRVTNANLGGVPVVWFEPGSAAARTSPPPESVIVYLHGGAYTMGNARNACNGPLAIARLTGLPVASVDYTLAPDAKWPQITDEVLAVFDALAVLGVATGRTALFGDSAGGGLAAGSVLKMRDAGRAMPCALVLWSPWADVTNVGDTFLTLAHADPLLDADMSQSALSYADPADHGNPVVSPVHGDFTRGFPPTLIQCGTREVLLSHAVRLYEALDRVGIPVQLDLYEGMPHVHHVLAPDSPEARRAFAKTARFMRTRLET